jgi:hypothetical protein
VEALRAALARHLVKGGEAVLVHVVSRAELEPARSGVLATDPEDKSLRRPLVALTRDGYVERFAAFRAEVARAMRADGVQVHEVRDDAAAETVIRRIARVPEGAAR